MLAFFSAHINFSINVYWAYSDNRLFSTGLNRMKQSPCLHELTVLTHCPKTSRCLSSKSMSKWTPAPPLPLCPVIKIAASRFPSVWLAQTHTQVHTPLAIFIGLSNAKGEKISGSCKSNKIGKCHNPWALEKNDGSFQSEWYCAVQEALPREPSREPDSVHSEGQSEGYSAWHSPFLTVRGAISLER